MKKILFKLFTYYNKKITYIPTFIIYLLNLIEFLQTIYYIINPQLQLYPQNSIIISVFTTVLSYINVFNLIRYNTGGNNFILVILVFTFMIVTASLIYYSYLKIVKKQQFWQLKQKRTPNGGFSDNQNIGKSKTQTFLINLTLSIILLIHTILAIPIYNILFPTFYCTQQTNFAYSLLKDTNCYDISHIGTILLSLISIIILISIKLISLTLFYQRNPFKNNIFACENNMPIMFQKVVVIAIVWYYIVDPLFRLKPLFIGAMALIYGWYLFVFRWQQIGFYNKKYMSYTLTLQILLFCFSLNNLIQFFLPSDTDRGIYLLQFTFCSCVLSYCSSSVIMSNSQMLLDKYYSSPQIIKKGKFVQMFWIELVNSLYHQSLVLKRRVCLRILVKQLDRVKLNIIQPQFVITIQKLLSSKQVLSFRQQRLIILQYLRIIVQQLIQIKQSFLFSGSRCNILFQQGFKTKSLCEIYKLEGEKLQWIDEFMLEQIKQRNCINSSNTSEQYNNNTNNSNYEQKPQQTQAQTLFTNTQSLDQQKIVVYDQYLNLISMLQMKINNCLNTNIEFWNQLLQEQPDFQYSKKLANKLLHYHQQIVLYHQNIHSLFQNSIKTKFLYFSYLQTLQWSQTHSQDILQFLQENQFNLQQKSNQKLIFDNVKPSNFNINFDENQKIVMIQLDFTAHQGYIRNTNSEIFNFLGYSKSQLIGRKIDKILPALIANKHSKFVEKFMNRKESIAKSSQRIVFAVHKSGYLKPGFLNIKVIYNQQKGMKLVSFIRPLFHQQRTFGILTTQQDTMIVGVTKQITLKVRDKQFVTEMISELVYMELLFPKLNILKLLPGKVYETQMTTFNNLEQELVQQKNVAVSLRYQQNNYQQNLNFRYYFVKYLRSQKSISQKSKLATSRSVSSNMLQTKSELGLTQPSFNTSKIIDQFQLRRQGQRQAKMQQLCRFKQNYLNKYNQSKYYVCLLVFMIVFGVGTLLCVWVYNLWGEFEGSVMWTRERMGQLGVLTRDVSLLQTRWLKIYMIENEGQLLAAKQEYIKLSQQFQRDLKIFTQYTTVQHSNHIYQSLFNLNIIIPTTNPQQQQQPTTTTTSQQRLRQILNFQQSSLLFTEFHLLNTLSVPQLQMLETLRNKLLEQASNILKLYIDQQLRYNLNMENQFQKIQSNKFYYNLAIILIQVLFLILSYIGIVHMKQYVQKNMDIIHYLTYTEIRSITVSLHQFLQIFLSTQSQIPQPVLLPNSQPHSNTTLLQNNPQQQKKRYYQKEDQEDNSLNLLLQKQDFSNGFIINNQILQKIRQQAQSPMKLSKDIMRVQARKYKKQVRKQIKQTGSGNIGKQTSIQIKQTGKNYMKQTGKNPMKQQTGKNRQSQQLTPIRHQLMHSDGEISRAVTSIARVSFNDLENNNNNKLCIKNGNNSNNSLQIMGSNGNIDNNNNNNMNGGNNYNMDNLDKKGAKSNRRSSFRKSAQILGLELITSAFQIGLSNIEENEQQGQHSNKRILVNQQQLPSPSNQQQLPSPSNQQQPTSKHRQHNTLLTTPKTRQGTIIRSIQQQLIQQPTQNNKISRKQRRRYQSLKLQTIQMQYPNRLWWVILCVVMIGGFGVVKQLLYRVQQNGENDMIRMGEDMNNLVKIDNKLMYLRSFIIPYYMNMTNNNNQPIVTKQTLFQQISTLQQYISLIYNEILYREQVLKDIYREITFYIYLLQTYQPDSKYMQNITLYAPQQLYLGIHRVLVNMMQRHYDLIAQIQLINKSILSTDERIQIYYVLEISVSIVLLLVILLVQYYLLIWRLKTDQEATFNMVLFIPLHVVTTNKNILKTIKKQSTKQ